VDVPLPRSRLGPAGPAGGALFGGVSKWPESAESIHVCGWMDPAPAYWPRHSPSVRGAIFCGTLGLAHAAGPTGRVRQGVNSSNKN